MNQMYLFLQNSVATAYRYDHILDIDECEGYNDCSQICKNTEGGYYCSCEEEYRLSSDGRTCEG